jgi:hypothetical protein
MAENLSLNKYDLEQARKQFKRLTKTAEGLAAIEEGLGVSVSKVTSTDTSRPIVALLVPCYHNMHPRSQHALNEMVAYSRQQGLLVAPQPFIQSSVVHWTRNNLISALIKTEKPWTHVLFMDDDIAPPKDALVKMMSREKDIVGALCTCRQDPAIPNMRLVNMETGDYGEVWRWTPGNLLGGDLPEGHALAIGTGLMLISRDALQKVADAYFECRYEKDIHEWADEKVTRVSKSRAESFDRTANAWWFRFLPVKDDRPEVGEDLFFCWHAKKYCGIDTYVDTEVLPEHWGDYGYSIADYLEHRNYAIEWAEMNGRYIPPALTSDKIVSNVLSEKESAEDEPLKISILCPTRGRPENVKRLMESIISTSAEVPELLFYVDEDDDAFPHIADDYVHLVRGPRITLSQCWNELAKVATGDILMFCGDDVVFKTKNWDVLVRNAFRRIPDKIAFVHGDDGCYGSKFGTHGFVHRNWVEAVGYLLPPYFSSDYGDTWLNEVANSIHRRAFVPMITEHMHFLFGKAELDQTHKERMERGDRDNVKQLYEDLAPKRAEDAEKLKAFMASFAEQKELQPVG